MQLPQKVGEIRKQVEFKNIRIEIREVGWVIKPKNQHPVIITARCGEYLVPFLRNPKKLFTSAEGQAYLSVQKYNREVSFSHNINYKQLNTKKDLGEKIYTTLMPRLFSIKIYEFGILLKLEKQEPIYLDKKQIDIICHYVRNKNQFKTIDKIKEEVKEKTIEAI